MNEEHEVRQRWYVCNIFTMWDSLIEWAECNKESNNEKEKSDNIVQDCTKRNETNMNNEIHRNNVRRVRVKKNNENIKLIKLKKKEQWDCL